MSKETYPLVSGETLPVRFGESQIGIIPNESGIGFEALHIPPGKSIAITTRVNKGSECSTQLFAQTGDGTTIAVEHGDEIWVVASLDYSAAIISIGRDGPELRFDDTAQRNEAGLADFIKNY